ncbi:NAD(P)-binding protein [Aulographum hederae CBS 113979]|uniref:NAD(P)-binding protein n=1 Tax=Aulographum hederae CBS 113979 TaxID=1176131 RepID=A0A6G1GZZ2_9PEZI|nr:NAD(P)-binding protein [Aulographum hederae CBS 113979]
MMASKDMPTLPKNFGSVFWKNQFRTKIEIPTPSTYPSLKDKTAIITGANTGLGYETARQLLTLGLSQLIVAVRSIDKGNAAAEELRHVSPSAAIQVWALDMESYNSIQAFVRRCESDLSRIDYTILNAGIANIEPVTTAATGHDQVIQVNHISTVLLTILLLPVLKTKSPGENAAKLTVVNSVTAHLAKFPNRDQRPLLPSFDDPSILSYNSSERYGVSKLLCQLFLVKLTEQIRSEDVVINMVDPGLTTGTGLHRQAKGALRAVVVVLHAVAARSLEQGAATYVDAAVAKGRESHGCFIMNEEIAPLATFYYTPDGKKAMDAIWDETLRELSFANVEEVLTSMK